MSERSSVAVVLSAGVLAAVSLGKFSPFLDQVRDGFQLSLTGAGWLTSSITAVAAAAATPIGRWADARRARPVLTWGLVTIALSGLAMSALGDTAWQLFALRLLEAVGYVAVMVAGPSLLTQVADAGLRKWALALWGMCIPAGLAAAAAVGGLLAQAGWRAWLATAALTSLIVAGMALRTVPGSVVSRGSAPSAGRPQTPVWLLASGFALVSMVGLAVVTLLPSFLTSEQKLSQGSAAALTSAVAASSILGSVLAGVLMQRGARQESLFGSALSMPLLGAGIFLGPSWLGSFVSAGLLMVVNGVVVATVFSALPLMAGVSGAGTAAGVVTQVGSVGTLLGPPLFGTAKESVGWWATLPLMAVAALVGVAALSLAIRYRGVAASEA